MDIDVLNVLSYSPVDEVFTNTATSKNLRYFHERTKRKDMNKKMFLLASLTTALTVLLASCASVPAGRLLFSRYDEATQTDQGTYLSLADGSGFVSIPMPGPEGAGRWSHSGTEITVMRVLDDGRIGTAIISPDGTVLRVLEIPDSTLNLNCWVWSPDDSRLACEGWDDAQSLYGIYTVRASDGGDLQRLITPPGDYRDLPGDFSPDGQFVFLRRLGGQGPGTLWLVGADGGEPRLLIAGKMEDPGRFSPDGLSVLTSTEGHLLVISLDGTVLQEISIKGKFLFGPAWSPDGTRIGFSMHKVHEGFADIYTSLPDGSDLQRVTNTPENEINLDWGVGGG